MIEVEKKTNWLTQSRSDLKIILNAYNEYKQRFFSDKVKPFFSGNLN